MDTRNQIVVLAAGKGTRMGHSDIPKVLVELWGKPMIQYILDEIKKLSLATKPIVVVGYKHAMVHALLGDACEYAHQQQQLGTGHAVWSAEKKVTAKDILVLYGDMPFIKASSMKQLMRLHADKRAKISMCTATPPHFEQHFASLSHYGRIIRDASGTIVKITEYKDASPEEREQREVNPGIYMFDAAWLWDNIYRIQKQNAQGEYYLTDIVEVAIAAGEPVYGHAINPKEVLGINTVEQLETASSFISVS